MPPKKRKNVKQTKITDMMETNPKKAQILVEPKPNNEIKQPEKFSACEQLPTESIFPYTLEEFTKRTNINDVITNYIRQKYPTALETYLTEPEIMSRIYKTYKVYYRNPERRCFAPMKYVHFNDDCEGITKEPVLENPDKNKQLCKNTDNEPQCVQENLKTKISLMKCEEGSPNENNIENVNDKRSIKEKIQALHGLKSIMSSNCDGHHEEIKESNLPVSFEKFKKYTSFHSVIDQICLSITQTGVNISKQEMLDPNKLLRSYYKAFYTQPDIRRIFPLKIKACPGRIKADLLKHPKIGSGNRDSPIRNESPKNASNINLEVEESSNKEIKLGSKTEDKNKENYSLALHLKAAKDNALNKSKLHQQKQNKPKPLSPIIKSNELNASANDFSTNVQKQDYTQKNTRESAIQGTSNEKIEVLSGLKSFLLPNVNLQTHNPPVSLEIFKKYVLYNEVIDQIYQDMVHTDNSLLILNPSEEKFLNRNNLLQSYYKAFYFQPNIRKLYRLRIKPCPAHLKAKLLSLPKKIYNIGTDSGDSMKSNENESSDNINVTVVELKDNSTKLHQNNMKCSSLQIKAAKDIAELKSKKHEPNPQTTPTKSSDSSSPAKGFMPKHDNSKESKQKSPKALLKERDETHNNTTHFTSAQINSDDEQHELDVASSKYRSDFTSLNLPVWHEFAEKKNEIAFELPENPKLTTKYDDSKFSLKFQDFLMGTNILDLLTKECNTTDDDLVNLAFEYYIKFVTNPKSQNMDPLNNLMVHANEKILKEFYTIYKQNEVEAKKHIKAKTGRKKESPQKRQSPTASKPIHKMPVSIAQFKKYTFYKEVVAKILKERAQGDGEIFSKLCKNKVERKKVLRSYYTNFYLKPSIRRKYALRLKEMPQNIKDKILKVPSMSTPVKKDLGKTTQNPNQKAQQKDVVTELVETDQSLNIPHPLLTTADKIDEKSLNSMQLQNIQCANNSSPHISTSAEDIPSTISQCVNNDNDKDGENNVVDFLSSESIPPEDLLSKLNKINELNINAASNDAICTISDDIDLASNHSFEETAIDLVENDVDDLPSAEAEPSKVPLCESNKENIRTIKDEPTAINKPICTKSDDNEIGTDKLIPESQIIENIHKSSTPVAPDLSDLSSQIIKNEMITNCATQKIDSNLSGTSTATVKDKNLITISIASEAFSNLLPHLDSDTISSITVAVPKSVREANDENQKSITELIQKLTNQKHINTESITTYPSFRIQNPLLRTADKSDETSLTPNALNIMPLQNIQSTNKNFTHISTSAEDMSSTNSQCGVNDDKNGINIAHGLLSSKAIPSEDPFSISNEANVSNVNNTKMITTIKNELTPLNNLIFTLNEDSDQMSCHSFKETPIDLESNSDELSCELQEFKKNVQDFKHL